ncbi:MAG: alpha/beta fold hydrolase [Paracoccaceae bacterium]
MRRFGRFLGRLFLALALGVAGLWAFGPRERVETEIGFDPAQIGAEPGAYLAEREGQVPGLSPEVAKRIVWAGASGERRTIALVYLHGFSATSEEIRPVPDLVAKAVGANLFYTRLTGHGLDGAALAEARAGDWLEDLAEALAIGRRLGDRVYVLATSTGGTLAALGAVHPDLAGAMDGIVFISPNFGIRSAAAGLLEWPLARYWVPLIAGAERAFQPLNAEQGRFWTTRYPTVAVMPMAATVRAVRMADLSRATVPALFLFSNADQVVSPEATQDAARRWGGPVEVETIVPGPGDDPMAHVIAGAIMSPGQTETVAARITGWIAARE